VELLYLLLGLVAALAETLVVYQAITNSRRIRLLTGLPLSKIGQLQPGLVKVQGRVLARGRTLLSPLSGRACVYCHFRVQEKRKHGVPPHGGGSFWKTVVNDSGSRNRSDEMPPGSGSRTGEELTRRKGK
jgi:hypothetical protein